MRGCAWPIPLAGDISAHDGAAVCVPGAEVINGEQESNNVLAGSIPTERKRGDMNGYSTKNNQNQNSGKYSSTLQGKSHQANISLNTYPGHVHLPLRTAPASSTMISGVYGLSFCRVSGVQAAFRRTIGLGKGWRLMSTVTWNE
jgi:hypothetical protein